MNRYDRGGLAVLFVSLYAVLGGACQRLDPNLTGGRVFVNAGAGGDGTDPGTGGSNGIEADCPSLRTQAFDILQTNCAICHQAPGTFSLYQGPFTFILDLAELTSSTSPQSPAGRPLRYVVNGNPGDSYIFQRITNGSMPPVTRTQRPSAEDKGILDQWITSCIDDPTSPQGWSGSGATPDAGLVDAGPTLVSCGAANVCPDDGCCVFDRCRPKGTTCGRLPSTIPGEPDLLGLPGMCTNRSCQRADGGGSCGSVGEPCCANQSCTASQAACLTTDMSMCSACGGVDQPCCKSNICLADHACVGARVGAVGTCKLCGGLDQPCCGSGVIALLNCNDAMVCVPDASDAGYGTRCVRNVDGGTQ